MAQLSSFVRPWIAERKWLLSQKVEEVSPAEMQRRWAEMVKK
jgi:hypothetical protein